MALYQLKIARFQQKYNLSMNMFSKKQNSSGIRKSDRRLKNNAPMKAQYGATNDEKT